MGDVEFIKRMDLFLRVAALAMCLFFAYSPSYAKHPIAVYNFSGSYSCEGDDMKEGKFSSKVTLSLMPDFSKGENSAYKFKLEVPGYGIYPGFVAAQGLVAAMSFENVDLSTKDFGVGVAIFKKIAKNKWSFNKYYYEPEFKGGNYGTELCVQD